MEVNAFNDAQVPIYREILKLECMLSEANIPHTLGRIYDGWQVCYPTNDPCTRVMDAIEHFGSYGKDIDKIEIMGLLTPYEEEHDYVLGYLTAEEVFKRIKKHYDGEWNSYISSLSVEDDEETPEEHLMTPEEFAKEMQDAYCKYDKERSHIKMDRLMADLLRQLGYGEGIDVFENTDKWYA